MNGNFRILIPLFVLALAWNFPAPVLGDTIPKGEIAALDAKLAEAGDAVSAARKKLAVRRVVRDCEGLLEKAPAAHNRFEVLDVLFRAQQMLVGLDNSSINRKAFLATAENLAAAPKEYAAIRLDADLLLTQAKAARNGGDSHARSDALWPMVERYRDTDVEAKVIRVAMIMALELGNAKLVNDLAEVVAKRFPGDLDLIKFQREKLAGQVFGAPFTGSFERSDGKMVRFPMDFLGTTCLLYFWTKEGEGMDDLKELAEAWKQVLVDPELKPQGRFQIVAMNMDGLPDAGEGILRGLGVNWQALKMPGGTDNPVYETFVGRETPTFLTVSPTGYAALYLSGSRSDRTYERLFGSWLARSWAKPRYSSQLQSVYSAEFLVMPAQGDFDPSAPPECQASNLGKLSRSEGCVSVDTLRAIQACFIDPPFRYRTPHEEVVANYKEADGLCKEATAAHPSAPDLWIVRNRRIAALMGLWKADGDLGAFEEAVAESKEFLDRKYPPGTDVLARLCLAREILRNPAADSKTIIQDYVKTNDSAPGLIAAALLAFDTGDRLLHDQYRRAFLDQFAESPPMWTATAFLLDRYHRYWQYHPPFVAGWTYGRRQGYFLSLGTPEEANRRLELELQTLDGEPAMIPDSGDGKWTAVFFTTSWLDDKKHQLPGMVSRYFDKFVENRGTEDVRGVVAVLDGDPAAVKAYLDAKPLGCETFIVPGGLGNPVVRKLGILSEDERPNVVLLRPDGSIALALSGLTMGAQKDNAIQNAIELDDERRVDEALARGDLDEAKRLAFLYAPLEEPVDPKTQKKKNVKITNPHLRSRAKVYLAMGDAKAAFADANECFLADNSQAGFLTLRTDELEVSEALRDRIQKVLDEAK
jgi:hypothetical protein